MRTPGAEAMNFSTGLGTRHVVAFMGFLAFILAYSMRFNLSLALVEMVEQVKSKHAQTTLNSTNADDKVLQVCPKHFLLSEGQDGNVTQFLRTERMGDQGRSFKDTRFAWSEEDQGLILGSFFWGYIITQYPGGKLSHMYGAKWIVSLGLLISALLSIALPHITMLWGRNGLLAVRVSMGIAQGAIFPATHVLIAHWSPTEERSRMTNRMFSGIPLGTAVTMITGGHLIHYFGWPSLFYVIGGCTIVWFVLWTFLVYDRPCDHPRISDEELKYIEASIHGQAHKDHVPTPWGKVVTSIPVIAIFIIHVGHTWGHYIMHSEIPKYLHSVHGFKIEEAGWLSASPQLLNFLICITMSNLSDYLIVKKITSTLFTRKLCSTLAVTGPALAFLGMIAGGCNTVFAIICLNIAGGLAGAGFGGHIVNLIDIAPNHAGSIMGIANTVSNTLGFLAPYVSGIILQINPALSGWRLVFLIPAAVNILTTIFYLTFAKTDEVSWNRPSRSDRPNNIPPRVVST